MGTPTEPAQRYIVTGCYNETGEFMTGTVEVIRRDAGDNVASLTVDDGQGNRATVLIGGMNGLFHAAHMGAVSVHM
jgi:hypothetical protein